ncbi:MAG: hypothetical protein R3C41_14725 [Calditrichia bacterium]
MLPHFSHPRSGAFGKRRRDAQKFLKNILNDGVRRKGYNQQKHAFIIKGCRGISLPLSISGSPGFSPERLKTINVTWVSSGKDICYPYFSCSTPALPTNCKKATNMLYLNWAVF